MDFSSYQSKGQLESPFQHYTKPANLHADNSGEQALAKANAETADVLIQGINQMREQYDQGKVMEANNEYNRMMSEGMAELTQRKEEAALNVVEDYDKLHQKTLEKVRKKFGQFINYGKSGLAFNEYTARDNNTRRENMLKYQMQETDKYHETQFNNQLAESQQMVMDGGGTDQAIDAALNRSNSFIEARFSSYGQEKIEQQKRIFKGQLVGSALQYATNMRDYARMGEISSKYNNYLDAETRVSVLSSLGKRQRDANELRLSNDLWVKLGDNASRDDIKKMLIERNQQGGGLQGFFDKCESLCGVEMDNKRNGCVEYVMKALSPFSTFGANNAGERNVGNLFRAASESGSGASVSRYNGQKLQAGDIIVYATPGDDITNPDNLEHVTVADGNGGYYGNSSGARDYEDENGNTVRGNGCGVHSDDQEIGGYEIAYIIRPDDINANALSEIELEDQVDRLYELYEKKYQQIRAAERRTVYRAALELQDMANHNNTDWEQYQAVVDKYSMHNGIVNDSVRVQLETIVNEEKRRYEKAEEKTAKGQPSGKLTMMHMDFIKTEVSKGTVRRADILKFCNDCGITSLEEQNKALKVLDDWENNKGEWAIPYEDIEAYVPGFADCSDPTVKARLKRTIHELATQEYRKMAAEHGGKLPGDIQAYVPAIAASVSKALTEGYYPGGNYQKTNHWYMPDALERRAVWVSHADLAAAGYISATYLGDKRNPSDEDHYMLLREDGTRDYMTGQELMALLNYVSIDRR